MQEPSNTYFNNSLYLFICIDLKILDIDHPYMGLTGKVNSSGTFKKAQKFGTTHFV